jgi:hypothetical protein
LWTAISVAQEMGQMLAGGALLFRRLSAQNQGIGKIRKEASNPKADRRFARAMTLRFVLKSRCGRLPP